MLSGARRAATAHALTLVTGVAAAVPVIVSTARALAHGWMPVGDQGIIATRAYDVFTAHTPLVGQYSQASTVAGHALYSPGPLLYWLLALPARFGTPGTLALAMGIVNTASIVAAVAVARRRGGRALMVAAALAIALMCHSLSGENLHDVFNPSAALLPFTLLVFLAWAVASGDHRLLPAAVVVGSYVAQCHLAYVLPVAGLGFVAAIGLASRARSPSIGRRRRAWPWLVAALIAAAISWSAPVVDEIGHSGNLGSIVTAATSQRTTQGADAGWRVVVHALGIPPRWLRTPQTTARQLGDVSGGDYGDTRLSDVWTAPGAGTTGSAFAVLVALVVVALAAARRGRAALAAAAAIALVLCLALAADVATTPTRATNTLGYTTRWGSVVGMWSWLVLAWGAAAARRTRALRAARLAASLAGLATVAAAGAAVAATERTDAHTPAYRPTGALAGGLGAVPRGRTVWLVQRGFVVVAIEPAIRFALRRREIRALGNLAKLRLGAWYELDHRRYAAIVAVYGADGPPVTPFKPVARATVVDRRGRHLVTVALSPPGARAR